MSFLSFLGYQLHWQLLRKRWLLPIPLVMFLAYRGINYLTRSGDFLPEMLAVNVWDLLFVTFGNKFNVYFVFALLFLYLVSDLLPETNLGQLVLFRLKSRKAWWLGKTLTTARSHAGLCVGLCRFSDQSCQPGAAPGKRVIPNRPRSGLTASIYPASYYTTGPLAPPFVFLSQELALLALGLFTFGLLMLVVNQLTGRYYYGPAVRRRSTFR